MNNAAAFIFAQTSLMNARLEAMKAFNAYAASRDMGRMYGEDAFQAVINEFEPIIGYNACVALFKEEVGE